ncbi:MAG: xanthine dehydrogenase family protein subunit M [Rhodospirillales bacterium]|nr:xanthine dehydrogenase family protein subunit M [Alphaproteobacteria bacterium]MBL6947654.1 xanthine dehydrogenase family protein subunit M [Rhodospirillales bacterium]
MRYESPETIEVAVALLAAEGQMARVFAGGTDLLVQMKEELVEPALLVDIKKISETRLIAIDPDQVRIGAAVTGAELGENEQLKAMWPGVVEAVELIGSAQVQGRATIGGNLCNASPAADSVPALIAAEARAVIAGPDGIREVPVGEFLTGPGQTSLGLGEFVTSITLPKPPEHGGDAYLRFIPRTEMDIAVVGAGLSVVLNPDGTCAAARLALGAVAPTARLVEAASEIMVGNKLDDTVLEALSAAASETCSPIDDKRGTIEFRTKVAGVLACRVAKIAWRRAENN